MSESKKDIKIVNGDGSNLDISHVGNHLNSSKPKCKDRKPKNIIIPSLTKKVKNEGNK